MADKEFADLAVYLRSHRGRNISGQAIEVDGDLETHFGMYKLN